MNDIKCEVIGNMDNSDGSLEIANRIYGGGGLSPCLNAHAGDTVPKIVVECKGNLDSKNDRAES